MDDDPAPSSWANVSLRKLTRVSEIDKLNKYTGAMKKALYEALKSDNRLENVKLAVERINEGDDENIYEVLNKPETVTVMGRPKLRHLLAWLADHSPPVDASILLFFLNLPKAKEELNMDVRSSSNRTFLTNVCRAIDKPGYLDVLRRMLEIGVRGIETPVIPAYDPVRTVVENHSLEALELLLEAGAKPEIQPLGEFDTTYNKVAAPITLAARFPDNGVEMMQLLLDNGAKIDGNHVYSDTEPSTLEYALIMNNERVVEFLLEKGASLTAGYYKPLYITIAKNNFALFDELLKRGVQGYEKVDFFGGLNALMVACAYRRTEMVKVLFETNRFNIDYRCENDGNTALLMALGSGIDVRGFSEVATKSIMDYIRRIEYENIDWDLVNYLVDVCEADVALANNGGIWPIHYLAAYTKSLSDPLDKFVKPDMMWSSDKLTPLHFAAFTWNPVGVDWCLRVANIDAKQLSSSKLSAINVLFSSVKQKGLFIRRNDPVLTDPTQETIFVQLTRRLLLNGASWKSDSDFYELLHADKTEFLTEHPFIFAIKWHSVDLLKMLLTFSPPYFDPKERLGGSVFPISCMFFRSDTAIVLDSDAAVARAKEMLNFLMYLGCSLNIDQKKDFTRYNPYCAPLFNVRWAFIYEIYVNYGHSLNPMFERMIMRNKDITSRRLFRVAISTHFDPKSEMRGKLLPVIQELVRLGANTYDVWDDIGERYTSNGDNLSDFTTVNERALFLLSLGLNPNGLYESPLTIYLRAQKDARRNLESLATVNSTIDTWLTLYPDTDLFKGFIDSSSPVKSTLAPFVYAFLYMTHDTIERLFSHIKSKGLVTKMNLYLRGANVGKNGLDMVNSILSVNFEEHIPERQLAYKLAFLVEAGANFNIKAYHLRLIKTPIDAYLSRRFIYATCVMEFLRGGADVTAASPYIVFGFLIRVYRELEIDRRKAEEAEAQYPDTKVKLDVIEKYFRIKGGETVVFEEPEMEEEVRNFSERMKSDPAFAAAMESVFSYEKALQMVKNVLIGLLSLGANPSLVENPVAHELPLVIVKNFPELVDILLEYGADRDVALIQYETLGFQNTPGYARIREIQEAFTGPQTMRNLALRAAFKTKEVQRRPDRGALRLPSKFDEEAFRKHLNYLRAVEGSEDRIKAYSSAMQEEVDTAEALRLSGMSDDVESLQQQQAAASSSSSSSSSTTSSSSPYRGGSLFAAMEEAERHAVQEARERRMLRQPGSQERYGGEGEATIQRTPVRPDRGRRRQRSPLSQVSETPPRSTSTSPATSPQSDDSTDENDPNKRQKLSALIAAKYGDHRSLHELLTKDPSLIHSAVSARGETLLSYAQKYGHKKAEAVIQQFISATSSH